MKIMKGLLKKNQVIIYVIALMLVTAGYLNYTTNTSEQVSAQTAMEMEANDDMQIADIGDATLVSSNDVVTNSTDSNTTNTENTIGVTEGDVNTSADANITTNTSNENNVATQTNATVTKDEYFTKSKLERDTMYSQMIESYENVLNSTNALETQKQSATEEIKKINDTKNSIMICENLIRTKGFANNIIFINGDSISVIVGVQELKQEEVAQIQNIISRELKAEIENIHISTK